MMSPVLEIILCIFLLKQSCVLVCGDAIQKDLSYMEGEWVNNTFGCDNKSYVMEISGISVKCGESNTFKKAVPALFNFLRTLCYGSSSCSILSETVWSFTDCQFTEVFIRINGTCVLESSLLRMCADGKIGPTSLPTTLYGPANATLEGGQTCRCTIDTVTEDLTIQIVTLKLRGHTALTLTSEDSNRPLLLLNSNRDHGNFIYNDTTKVNVSLSATESDKVDQIILLIESDNSSTITCFHTYHSDHQTTQENLKQMTTVISEGYSTVRVTDTSSISTGPTEQTSYASATSELVTSVFTSTVEDIETSYNMFTETVSNTSPISTFEDQRSGHMTSLIPTFEYHSTGHTTSLLEDKEDITTNGTIIIIVLVVAILLLIIGIVVTVFVCKRKKLKCHTKQPQYPDSTTVQPLGCDKIPNIASKSTNNKFYHASLPLQNVSTTNKTEFLKPDDNSTSGLNELYGSTESGIAVSTDPEGLAENNTFKTGKDLYDEALPVSHDPNVYKPSVFPGDLEKSSDPLYYLYDDSHKDPKTAQTGTYSGSSGDSTFCPEITDYAPSYLKTKGDDIKTLKPLAKQIPMNIANSSAQSLQAYSYADTRGRFVEGITPHIVGQGYDVEKPLPADKYEQFQSPGGTNKVNMTGSKTNLGPYSYAACSVNPNPTGDLKPLEDASLAHYESMNAIYKPKETDNNESEKAKYDNVPNPPAEYEGVAFSGKGQTPVVVDGVEMVENDVYSKD